MKFNVVKSWHTKNSPNSRLERSEEKFVVCERNLKKITENTTQLEKDIENMKHVAWWKIEKTSLDFQKKRTDTNNET